MQRIVFVFLLAGFVLLCGSQLITVSAFQGDQSRSIFLESRQKATEQPATNGPENRSTKRPSENKPHSPVAPLGLGMTVFLKNNDGVFTRVSPTHLFKSGQKVRILVESNSDGYLYIFHQENDGAPEMIFPDYRVNRGDNQITAHLPMEVPFAAEFAFDEKPAIETLTLVVSRTPIAGVPVGKNLESRQSTHVPPNVLNQLAINTESKEDVQSDDGATMTVEEGTRGMKLSVSDPSPTKLVVNRDKIQNRIVAKLRLTHQ